MANQYTDHQYELFKEQINMFKETCTDYSEEDLFELAYEQLTDALENYKFYDYKNAQSKVQCIRERFCIF